jgi:hypothetical protein
MLRRILLRFFFFLKFRSAVAELDVELERTIHGTTGGTVGQVVPRSMR